MKRQSLLLTILLYYFTGGVYAIIWLNKIGYIYYDAKSGWKHYITKIIILAFVALIISVFLVIGIGLEHLTDFIEWFYIFSLSCVMVIYGFSFIVVTDVAKSIMFERGVKCSLRLVGILTFIGLTSIIYLQWCINKQVKQNELYF